MAQGFEKDIYKLWGTCCSQNGHNVWTLFIGFFKHDRRTEYIIIIRNSGRIFYIKLFSETKCRVHCIGNNRVSQEIKKFIY